MTATLIPHELIEKTIKFLILGVIQGISEFLPISSTAHLKVIPMMIGWGDPGISISAAIQLGSILAVIIYFKQDIKSVLKGIYLGWHQDYWRRKDSQLGLSIIAGTIPIVLAGLLIKLFWKDFENTIFRSIPGIACLSICMAVLLALSEKFGVRNKKLDQINITDGVLIGIGQMFALIPGVSRSGISISFSLMNGFKREDAARFSFLLGIPAISIAGLVGLQDVLKADLLAEGLPLLAGIFSAAIVSWLSIDWLLKYLQTHGTWIFVIYRILFGISLLVWHVISVKY